MARAIVPVHSMFDGDTVFGLASGRIAANLTRSPLVDFNRLLAAAADVFADACSTPFRQWPGQLAVLCRVGSTTLP